MLVGVSVTTGAVKIHRDTDVVSKENEPEYYQQRPALAIDEGRVYISFGGLAGDCGPHVGTIVGVPLSIGMSLIAALLLNSPMARAKAFFRTSLFAPVVTTLVAVAVIWRYLFHTRYGLVNYALGMVHIGPIDWLGDPHWAMPTIVLLAVWKNFGYNMVIFLAGLQAIPRDLYEAARIDGASSYRQFVHVTLPMLGPTLSIVSLLTIAGYFQIFAEPYVMTQGGPLRSTLTALYFMYDEGFKWWNLGTASAVAFMLFVPMFLITSLLLRTARTRQWA